MIIYDLNEIEPNVSLSSIDPLSSFSLEKIIWCNPNSFQISIKNENENEEKSNDDLDVLEMVKASQKYV